MRQLRAVAQTDSADSAQGPVLFDPEQIGRSLREVAVDVIETEGSPILSRWFQSSRDVELLIWTDSNKNVIKHQITFFGQVVEWNVFEGVKTGVVIEEEGTGDTEDNVRETIRFDSGPDATAVGKAIRVVEFTSELKDTDRLKISENLRVKTETLPPADDTWKRLRRWFSGT